MKFVKKGDQVQEIMPEDLDIYIKYGWTETDKPEETKKGKKREEVEE